MSHLHGRVEFGFSRVQSSFDDGDLVVWGIAIGHERKRVFALNQADFDIDAIE